MKQKKNRKNIKNGKSVINYAPRCPYCGSTTVYRSATGIYQDNSKDVMLYVCKNYPACDTYVQAQKGTAKPLGTMANRELRALRAEAHRKFNKLYQQKYMTKMEAYNWLGKILGVPRYRAHIGMQGVLGCNLVIKEAGKLLTWCEQHREAAKANIQKGEVRAL